MGSGACFIFYFLFYLIFYLLFLFIFIFISIYFYLYFYFFEMYVAYGVGGGTCTQHSRNMYKYMTLAVFGINWHIIMHDTL